MKNDSCTARFAVDFVVLPPDDVMDIAISLNKRDCNKSYIELDRQMCFPHISLLMGCLRPDQLKDVGLMLKSIASRHKAMVLNVTHTQVVSSSAGDILTMDVDRNKHIQLLHEDLVKVLASELSTDATETDVFSDSPLNMSTLEWINGYISHSCFENFWPHITIGYTKEGPTFEKIDPFAFTASRIAMCHLGNYCTCRKILNETRLAE